MNSSTEAALLAQFPSLLAEVRPRASSVHCPKNRIDRCHRPTSPNRQKFPPAAVRMLKCEGAINLARLNRCRPTIGQWPTGKRLKTPRKSAIARQSGRFEGRTLVNGSTPLKRGELRWRRIAIVAAAAVAGSASRPASGLLISEDPGQNAGVRVQNSRQLSGSDIAVDATAQMSGVGPGPRTWVEPVRASGCGGRHDRFFPF